MSNMTFDTYFEIHNDLEENKLIDLHNRYNLFYKSEDNRDQESIGRIIQRIRGIALAMRLTTFLMSSIHNK
jgi:hypothetical protein